MLVVACVKQVPDTTQVKIDPVTRLEGHGSITITLDNYSHVSPGLQEADAERFDGILSPDVSKMLTKINDSDSEPLVSIDRTNAILSSKLCLPLLRYCMISAIIAFVKQWEVLLSLLNDGY